MEQRKPKQVTDIIDYIKDNFWNLSIQEEAILDSFLILFSAQKTTEIKKIEHLLNDETEELLKLLNDREVIDYAEDCLGMIDEDDVEDCKDLNEYDDDALLDECSRRNFNFEIDDVQDYDLVDDNLLYDIKEVFNNLNVFDRKRLRDEIINFK